MAQGNDSIDPCRPPRGEHGGDGRSYEKRSSRQQQAAKGEGLDLEQQRLNETRQIQSAKCPERDADERGAAGVRKHRSDDSQMPGAERYSYTDLPCPFENGVTQDPIDADANKDEPDAGEEARDQQQHAFAQDGLPDENRLRGHGADAEKGTRRLDGVAQTRRHALVQRRRANINRARAPFPQRDVHSGHRWLPDVVLRVRGNADDLARRTAESGSEASFEPAADGILLAEVQAGKRFTDDDARRLIAVDVAPCKTAAVDQADGHRFEEAVADRLHVRLDARVSAFPAPETCGSTPGRAG